MKEDYSIYANLEAEFGDQFYLFDRKRLLKNIDDFYQAFVSRYPRVALCHSYKTNYTPAISCIAKDEGLYAEVVSGIEYEMAVRIGYSPHKIIFNGPIKTYSDLKKALLGGAIVNVDHLAEVEMIVSVAREYPHSSISVGIRCNADYGATIRSRFGLAEDSGELAEGFHLLLGQPNISVAGIHIHTSAIRTPESYRKRAEFAVEVIKKYFKGSMLEYIDMGGGFPSVIPRELQRQLNIEQTDFGLYADALCAPFLAHFSNRPAFPLLFLEPGLALFANVFRLCTKVLALKQVGERSIAILSGGIHTVKPTGHALNMPVTHFPKNPGEKEKKVWDLTGYTCIEHDLLYEKFEGVVSIGDYFVFDQVGAYTTVLKPPLIKTAPPILEMTEKGFRLLRAHETLDQILASYTGNGI